MAKTRVDGLAELKKQLAAMGDDLAKKAARSAVSAGASEVRKKAKQIAKAKGLEQTGLMIKNIVTGRSRRSPFGVETYAIGVKHGRRFRNSQARKQNVRSDTIRDPFYFRFHEFARKTRGKSIRGQRSRGLSRLQRKERRKKYNDFKVMQKQIPAKPFLAPALQQAQGQAVEAIKKKLAQQIQKFQKQIR